MKVLVYGTGQYSDNFCLHYGNTDEIIGYIQSSKTKTEHLGKHIYSKEEIANIDYDAILIAVWDSDAIYDIKRNLYMQNVSQDKVRVLKDYWYPIKQVNSDGFSLDFLNSKILSLKCPLGGVFFDFDGIYTDSIEVADYCLNLNLLDYWKDNLFYAEESYLQLRGEFIEKNFLPLIKSNDELCEFACGNGQWSRYVAPYCKKIAAYDVSEKEIAMARKLSDERGIQNITYHTNDARETVFDRMYDHFMMVGLANCINDLNIIADIIKNISEHIKSGGYFLISDSLNFNDLSDLYFCSRITQYKSVHHNLKEYHDLFYNNGFKHIVTDNILRYHYCPVSVGVDMSIFQKI